MARHKALVLALLLAFTSFAPSAAQVPCGETDWVKIASMEAEQILYEPIVDGANSRFGRGISLSPDQRSLLVGGPDTGFGRVAMYRLVGDAWEGQNLDATPPNMASAAQVGTSVAVGGVLAIAGSVYGEVVQVFDLASGDRTALVSELTGGANYGNTVRLNHDATLLFVGDRSGNGGAGTVWIYNTADWSLHHRIDAEVAGYQMGQSIAVSGDYCAIGGYQGTGRVEIRHRDEGGIDSWGLLDFFTGVSGHAFGIDLALSPDADASTLVITAISAPSSSGGANGGRIDIFERTPGTTSWVYSQSFTGEIGDRLGRSPNFSPRGDALLIGVSNKDLIGQPGTGRPGGANVYTRGEDGAWALLVAVNGTQGGGNFGSQIIAQSTPTSTVLVVSAMMEAHPYTWQGAIYLWTLPVEECPDARWPPWVPYAVGLGVALTVVGLGSAAVVLVRKRKAEREYELEGKEKDPGMDFLNYSGEGGKQADMMTVRSGLSIASGLTTSTNVSKESRNTATSATSLGTEGGAGKKRSASSSGSKGKKRSVSSSSKSSKKHTVVTKEGNAVH